MVTIRLTNTATHRKEEFHPIDPANVRMYVCGPTVYDRAHLGNARPVVVFDVLFRLLRQVYGEKSVTYVRNFTDVDDKINATAQARKAADDPRSLEALIRERTDETIGWYHADMDALGALRPTHEPRATEYIGAMIGMIEKLIERGHAYVVREPTNNPPRDFVLMDRESAGHSLFDVHSYSDYGQLSGRTVEDMIAGARVEVAPYKRNPSDFVLWKPSDEGLPGWDSPWGRGRPGWHIECSAMSFELLGDTFDIHGGGIDLQFPHHENERAQSCCALATPDDPLGRRKFARYWLHNEMLQVEGKKMSKSLGNFFTVRDLLDKGVPGEVIRLVFLGTHYRKPMDWTAEKADQAEATLRKWRKQTRDVTPGQVHPSVREAVADDLNTAEAIKELHVLSSSFDAPALLASAQFLGLLTPELGGWDDVSVGDGADRSLLQERQEQMTRMRAKALRTKDFSRLDAMKSKMIAAGVSVKMTKDGVLLEPADNFDSAQLSSIERDREAEE